jgi:hypothetical protein
MRRRNEISSNRDGTSVYVYKKIPSRQDGTLIQARSGSMRAVPASLFPVIQAYLPESDYRNLMNTNLSIFQDSKYETVRYSFSSLLEWRKLGLAMNPPINLPTIINYIYSMVETNVKDISKQVSLRIQGFMVSGFDRDDCMDNMYYKELYKLSRCHKVIFRNCPRIREHYFDNIYHVIIHFNDFVEPFPPGVKNVKILEIHYCEYLEDIQNVDDIDGLQQLIIAGSGVIHNFCDFRRIPVVRLDWKNADYEIIQGFTLPLTLFPQFSFLQELILKTNFASSAFDSSVYQCFVNIPVLGLHQIDHSFSRPVLPVVLQARVLEISGFNIASWEEGNFTNLEMLRLENCVFEGVDRLSVSFPMLHTLEILGQCNLELSRITSLKTLRVKETFFTSLSELPVSLTFLSLEFMSGFPDSLECFAAIPHLEFFFCLGLSSLEGLSDLNRVVRVHGCPMITDFRPLRHVHRLSLENMEVADTKWFSDIKHLKFVNCTGLDLKTTVNLASAETLYISGCPLVRELPHYDRVKISVWNCKNLTNFGEGVTFLNSPGHVEFVVLDKAVNLPFKGYKPL